MSRQTSAPTILRVLLIWALPSLWLLTGCAEEPLLDDVRVTLQWRLEDAVSGAHVLCEPGEKVRLVGEGLSTTSDCTDSTGGNRNINGILAAGAQPGEYEARLELLDSAGNVLASTPLRFTLSSDMPNHDLGVQRLTVPSRSGTTGGLVLTWQKKSASGQTVCSCAGREYLEVEVVGEGARTVECVSFDGSGLLIESGVYGKELSLPSGAKQLNVRLKENQQGTTLYAVNALSVTLVPGRRVHQHVTFVTCST